MPYPLRLLGHTARVRPWRPGAPPSSAGCRWGVSWTATTIRPEASRDPSSLFIEDTSEHCVTSSHVLAVRSTPPHLYDKAGELLRAGQSEDAAAILRQSAQLDPHFKTLSQDQAEEFERQPRAAAAAGSVLWL